MRKNLLLLFAGYIACFGWTTVQGQTLVNREWVQIYGLPDTISWSASATDASGNLYTAGNTFSTGSGTDVLLTKYDAEGTQLWQQVFDYQSMNDYGTAILIHSSGDIVVAAAVFDLNDDFNIAVIRYTSSGTVVWSQVFDRASSYDVPVALAEVASGNIVCAATSHETGTGLDYYLLSLVRGSGNMSWDAIFDYNLGRDVPVSMVVVDNEIVITGATEDSSAQWDFTTIAYDSSGNFQDAYTLDKPGIGFDEPAAIAKDAQGNFYLCGRGSDNGQSYYLQTVKLNSQLDIQWEQEFSAGPSSGATGLGIDKNGNVYVCGFSGDLEGESLILLRYDASGSLDWHIEEALTDGSAVATSLQLDWSDQIYVMGYKAVNNQQRLFMALYSDEGEKLWEQTLADAGYGSGNIVVHGTSAYVTTKRYQNSQYQYLSLRIRPFEHHSDWQTDSVGNPFYATNELIVKFDEQAIDSSAVDDVLASRKVVYGTLGYFLKPDALNTIEEKIQGMCGSSNFSGESCPITAIKIFRDLKTTQKHTLSRLGDTIDIPSFWSAFLLALPPGLDPLALADSLRDLFPLVQYAHLNYAITPVTAPNDSLYSQQTSLQVAPSSTIRPDINVEGAWQIETGKPWIRLGVFDSGIEWDHEDFLREDDSTTTIAGGWNAMAGVPMLYDTHADVGGHGTPVAGIIGAVRNNQRGVAGIAGGSLDGNGTYVPGVSIYGIRIYDGAIDPDSGITKAMEMIVGAAIEEPGSDYGFGLHIMNNSWTYKVLDGANKKDPVTPLMDEAIRFANRAQVVFVAARGNGSNTIAGESDIMYPGCSDEDWVLCVGGTGTNGDYIKQNQNGEFSASTGPQIDVAAPASLTNVRSLTNLEGYAPFNGTSSATPHVSALAGLLLSYCNDSFPSPRNLSPEDVERILELSSVDCLPFGPDTLTGYGRINATRALQLVQKPWRKVRHYANGQMWASTRTVATLPADTIRLANGYRAADSTWYDTTAYRVTPYQITTTVQHALPGTDSLLYAWPRHSRSNLFPLPDAGGTLLPREKCTLTAYNQSSATLTGYVYKVSNLGGSPLGWIPFDTSAVHTQVAYTLLTHDSLATGGVKPHEARRLSATLFPNPTEEKQALQIVAPASGPATIQIFDISGKPTCCYWEGTLHQGNQRIALDLQPLKPGIYFYRIQTTYQVLTLKLVKN